MRFRSHITPVSKSHEDYEVYKDKIRWWALGKGLMGELPYDLTVKFYLPMPDDWPKKKREEMIRKPHQEKPDADELLKGLTCALYSDARTMYRIEVEKKWDLIGGIEIKTAKR